MLIRFFIANNVFVITELCFTSVWYFICSMFANINVMTPNSSCLLPGNEINVKHYNLSMVNNCLFKTFGLITYFQKVLLYLKWNYLATFKNVCSVFKSLSLFIHGSGQSSRVDVAYQKYYT